MKTVDKEREERLAAALRENLRRRKAQARKIEETAKDEGEGQALGVAVAKRLFAQRALDAAGNRVADPDDRAEEKHGEGKHESCGHESNLRHEFLHRSD